jgi:hypothetical protein
MASLRDTWSVRTGSQRLELAVGLGALDAEAVNESLHALRALVWDARAGRRESCAALVDVHSRLLGDAPPSSRVGSRLDVDTVRMTSIADELLAAVRAGRLVVRRQETRTLLVPAEDDDEPVLGPAPASDDAPDTASWIGVVLLDQDGAPVAGKRYRIQQADGTTSEGTLDDHGTAFVRNIPPGNCQVWCPLVDAHPKTTYEVKPGDHVSGIAESFGFDDFSAVWGDPGNGDLSGQRTNPHVLQPGDAVTVPEVKGDATANKPTGAKHTFTIKRSPLKLRLKMLDLAAKPVTGAQVSVDGAPLTTDGDGLVEAKVDKGKRDADLDMPTGAEMDLAVGGLNPNDDTSDAGYKARLFNLGFLWDPAVGDGDDEMTIALEDFQAQYGLDISGQLDDATKSQLVQVYGC